MRFAAAFFLLFAFVPVHSQTEVDSVVEELAVQKDGKIVAAGTSSVSGKNRFAILRYLPDGRPDLQFGERGTVMAATGKGSKLFAVAIQEDGKILGAGYSDTGRSHAVALARFTRSGVLDLSFGKFGWVTTETGLNYARAFEILLQKDGKLVAIGHSNTRPAGGFEFLAIRYNPDGSLDRAFGIGGIVRTKVGTGNNGGQTGALQEDGKILIGGEYGAGKAGKFAVSRYMPDGKPDDTFGTGGLTILPVNGSASAIAFMHDGHILILGDDGDPLEPKLVASRLDSSGKVDASFASNGIARLARGSLRAISRNSDETMVLTGSSFAEDAQEPEGDGLMSCIAALSIDRTGSKAVPTARLADEDFDCSSNDVVFQSDGKMLLGGAIGNFGSRSFVVFRFNSDGAPDVSFGNGGKVVESFRSNPAAGSKKPVE